MHRKNKRYLEEENVPITKYMKKKIRKFDRDENFESEIPWVIEKNESIEESNTNIENEKSEENFSEHLPNITHELEYSNINVQPAESEAPTDSIEHENIDVNIECDTSTTLLNTSFCESFDEAKSDFEAILQEDLFSDDETLDILKEKNATSPNLERIMKEPTFLKSVGTNVEQSPGELLLMSLKFSLANNHSFTSLTGLCQFVNSICRKHILPETRYKINRLCNSDDNTVLYGVCNACSKFIGTFQNQNAKKNIQCESCKMNVNVSNRSNSCYFSIFDPSDAIRDYLQSNEKFYDFVIKDRIHQKDTINDIYDGKMYRNFIKNLSTTDRHNYVTVTFNTDGAPVFKSSSFSIWPIYLCLNEIPVQSRLDCIIVSGLWFGKNKPEMSIFLEKFVETMNQLSDKGILCTIKGEIRHIKVYPLLACVDNVARAPVQGTSQFNAYYGCNWCMHRGDHYDGSMRYPYLNPLPGSRNAATTFSFAKEALRTNKPVFGVKTASPLFLLNNFDIITGFTPDYMHCLLAGVGKQYTEYILNYLRTSEYELINSLFSKIKVPHQISRLARPLKDRADWKSREWENWILYYSVPLLTQVLKSKERLEHWTLLTESLHIALQTEITYAELNRLNGLLYKFVSQAKDLYTLTALTYNTHQMLHIGESIYNWGPLWAHSAFCFESANYYLLRAIKCGRGVIQQIIRFLNLKRCVQILEKVVYPENSSNIEQFYNDINEPRTKKVFKLSSITYLGKEEIINLLEYENLNVSRTTKVFHRMIMKNTLFMSSKKNNTRSCNYFAQLNNGHFIKIICFLVDTENNCELTLYQLINVNCYKNSNFIKEILTIENEIDIVETKEIKRSAVFIKVLKHKYIIATPNMLYY